MRTIKTVVTVMQVIYFIVNACDYALINNTILSEVEQFGIYLSLKRR